LDQRAEDGDAERAADHAAHRQRARGDAAFVRSTAFIAAVLIGDITRPIAKPSARTGQQERVARVCGQVRLPEQRAGDREEAGDEQRPRTDPVGERPAIGPSR